MLSAFLHRLQWAVLYGRASGGVVTERMVNAIPEDLLSVHQLVPAIEWIAVLAGAKPACRQVVASTDVEQVAAAARERGLVIVAEDAAEWIASWHEGVLQKLHAASGKMTRCL